MLLINSSSKIRPKVHSSMSQPGATAKAKAIGNTAEIMGPTYGTKRMMVASAPHKSAPGTPISHRPNAMGMP
ncbi:hypothetical protein D3C72_1936230 [compost metagenome]